MAIKATLPTIFGEDRELYVRPIVVETSKHGVPSRALYRGFLSREAFEARKAFLWEHDLEFTADVTRSSWDQAYEVLKAHDPVAPIDDEIARATEAHTAEVDHSRQLLDAGAISRETLDQLVADGPPNIKELEARRAAAIKLRDALGKAENV